MASHFLFTQALFHTSYSCLEMRSSCLFPPIWRINFVRIIIQYSGHDLLTHFLIQLPCGILMMPYCVLLLFLFPHSIWSQWNVEILCDSFMSSYISLDACGAMLVGNQMKTHESALLHFAPIKQYIAKLFAWAHAGRVKHGANVIGLDLRC